MSSQILRSIVKGSKNASALGNSLRLSTYNGVRAMSTEKNATAKTSSVLDVLPGDNIATKAGYLTAGAAGATYLISQDIYIINEESLVLASFAFVIGYLYKTIREPYSEWAEGRLSHINKLLTDARQEHKEKVQVRIEEASQLADIVPVTKDLFTMSKEIAETQSKVFELKQQVAVASEVKSVLDSWVRYENSLREREQRELSNSVITSIEQALKDPKLQDQILKEAVQEVERLTAKH